MKVALSWFNDYTNITVSPKEFEHGMTMSGTKVEGITEQGAGISGVFTGKITRIEKHPDADKLQVCTLDMNTETLQIITAATNVFEGAIVPVATHGAKLPIGMTIKKGKMRGVESCGMLCSENELALQQEPVDGIMILDEGTPLGADIREVLGLNDAIVEFEITSNRPDCQSVIGLAREVAVTFKQPFKLNKPNPKEVGGDINEHVSIQVADSQLCPRYTARLVKNVKVGPSPKWMQDRLLAGGVRAINNIVDITNYVMLEYGQPLHAFDMKHVTDGKIIVRHADKDEPMTTLDEKEHVLDENMLVIADGARPVAIAGVMGGLNSEVENSTTTVLFESANFLSSSVRQTAKKLGIRTESSARFEKGLSPEMTLDAVNRACELVCMLGCGEVVGGVIDIKGDIKPMKGIPFLPERINGLLGTDISREIMVEYLLSLGFEINGDEAVPPPYRADAEGVADLAEEVARLYGYNNIPNTLLRGDTTPGGLNEKQRIENIIRQNLVAQGLYEILTYSFVDPAEYELLEIDMPNTVKILNPLGEERSIMRTNTIGSMMETLKGNYNYRNPSAWLFELGKVYLPVDGQELPNEKWQLTIGMYGDCDYYTLKGVMENLFDTLGIPMYDIEPLTDNCTFHPGQTAKILLRKKPAAVIGRIHPTVQENYDIGTPVYMAVFEFDKLFECKKLDKKYKPLPKFPSTTRDIAMILEDSIPVKKIDDIIRRVKTNIVESSKLFDVYKGKQVKDGHKSVAYSITFRASDRTLTDAEVNEVMQQILDKIKTELNAELR